MSLRASTVCQRTILTHASCHSVTPSQPSLGHERPYASSFMCLAQSTSSDPSKALPLIAHHDLYRYPGFERYITPSPPLSPVAPSHGTHNSGPLPWPPPYIRLLHPPPVPHTVTMIDFLDLLVQMFLPGEAAYIPACCRTSPLPVQVHRFRTSETFFTRLHTLSIPGGRIAQCHALRTAYDCRVIVLCMNHCGRY